jgi:hypothetical protein
VSTLKDRVSDQAMTDVDFLRARGATEKEIAEYRNRKRKKFLESLKKSK